jgi:predicted outer membrane protein
MKTRIILLISALLCGAVASSQTTSGPVATTPAGDLLDADVQALVEKTMQAYMQIVGLSRIASERAINPDVKTHALETVDVLDAAHAELKGLVPFLAHTRRTHRENAFDDRGWRTKTPEDFDGDYLKKAVELYEEIGELLDEAAGSGIERLQQHAERQRATVALQQEKATKLREQHD